MALSGPTESVCYLSALGGKADMLRPRMAHHPVANDAVDGARSAASKCHRVVASKPERFKEVRPGNDDGVPKFWRNRPAYWRLSVPWSVHWEVVACPA